MAEFLSWNRLLESGGPALIVLLICSIISVVVIIERTMFFTSKSIDPRALLEDFLARLRGGRELSVADSAEVRETPAGYLLAELVDSGAAHAAAGTDGAREFDEIKGRAIAEKLPEMERYLGIVATLGTVSPYIGLLGTVLGIIRAFLSLGGEAGGDATASMNQLNAGIAEALIATAAGLFVAIPATVAYNYFRRRVNEMVLNMEVAASRLKSALRESGKG
ncbi:MAG: MotA/TolQ/ExbB proton channel family protein [bacterium]|nr:MotA/TolQ/ExbB proton channel family protein [bacterium]